MGVAPHFPEAPLHMTPCHRHVRPQCGACGPPRPQQHRLHTPLYSGRSSGPRQSAGGELLAACACTHATSHALEDPQQHRRCQVKLRSTQLLHVHMRTHPHRPPPPHPPTLQTHTYTHRHPSLSAGCAWQDTKLRCSKQPHASTLRQLCMPGQRCRPAACGDEPPATPGAPSLARSCTPLSRTGCPVHRPGWHTRHPSAQQALQVQSLWHSR